MKCPRLWTRPNYNVGRGCVRPPHPAAPTPPYGYYIFISQTGSRSRLRPAICFYKRNRSRLRPAISFYKRNGLAFAPPSTPPSSRYMFLQAGRSRLRSRLRPAMCFYKQHGPAFDPAFALLCVFTSGTVPPSAPPLSCFRSRLRPASCFYKRNGPAFVPSSSRYMFLQAGWSRLRPAFVPLYVFTSGTVPLSIPPSPRYVFTRGTVPPSAPPSSRFRSCLRPAICFYKRGGPTVDRAFVPLYVFTSGSVPPSPR